MALAVLLLAGFASTGAYAYWTTSGQGTASGSAGTLEKVILSRS